ncbi:MAG: hypothetical protein HUJ95_00580 [Bacteroidales bacterium]|nr:hypothetical protein [Bacteroidales bacterium]
MSILKKTIFFLSAALLGISCVEINQKVGSEFLSEKDRFEIKFFDMDITDISLKEPDSLSNYSTSRAVFGSMYDETFGLTTRGTTFTLIPMESSIDLGLTPVLRSFHFAMARDTLSVTNPVDEVAIQNILVYELEQPVDTINTFIYSYKPSDFAGKPFISKGHPVYSGGDSLSFDFSEAYANKFLEVLKDYKKNKEYCDSVKLFVKEIPGIYICTDEPTGGAGRINLMRLPVKYDSDLGYITGNYAELKIRTSYFNSDSTDIRENVDTSFYFYYGATTSYSPSKTIVQYCYNFSESESKERGIEAKAAAENALYVESAGGVKPVISSKSLREAFLAHLKASEIDPKRVIINKATLSFHYDYDGSVYEKYAYYPDYLSPWVRLSHPKYVAYAGITDYSVTTENQGDINRSCLNYSPDITHHFQEIIRCDTLEVKDNPAKTARNYAMRDIWLMILANEVVVTESTGSSTTEQDYYNALMYSQYYNNMYGYGGYGGYGYDSYNYNNYYNYAMLASMYSSTTTTEYTKDVDLMRYYNCKLYSATHPDASLRPHLKVTYSVRKQ